jgi:hypothetical protein
LARHVTTNIPSCFGIVWIVLLPRIISWDSSVDVWGVKTVLICEHFLCYVLAELYDLFADVSQECIAWQTSNEHDGEDGTFSQVHCHGRTRSNQVRSNSVFGDA